MSRHIQRLRSHALQLACELGVEIAENDTEDRDAEEHNGGCAIVVNGGRTQNYALVALSEPIASTSDYFTALHELGHLATLKGPRRFRWKRPPVLTAEVKAWRWALKHTCVKPTRAAWRNIASAMGSYALFYQDDRRVYRDPDFYRLLRAAIRRA